MGSRWDLRPNKIQGAMLGIIIAALVFLAVGIIYGNQIGEFARTVLLHLSSSLLILGVVIFAFEVYLRNDSLDKVENIFSDQIAKVNDKIDVYIINRDHLLKMASENGIIDIFSKRASANNRMVKEFNTLIKEKKLPVRVDLLGISLKDFVRPEGGYAEESLAASFRAVIDSLGGDDFKKTWSLRPGPIRTEEQKKTPYDALIRILILYPFSKTAVLRVCREEASYGVICSREEGKNEETISTTRLYHDVTNTLKSFYEYYQAQKTYTNVNIEVRLCTFNPMIYSVRINDLLFKESYHLGKIANEDYIGGKSLILLYNSGVQSKIITNHFDHLWDHPATIKFRDAINWEEIENKEPLRIKKPRELAAEYQNAIREYSI
jgi:hypothetical protein